METNKIKKQNNRVSDKFATERKGKKGGRGVGDLITKNRLPLFSPVQTVASTCIVFGGAELGERFSPVRVPGNASFDRAV